MAKIKKKKTGKRSKNLAYFKKKGGQNFDKLPLKNLYSVSIVASAITIGLVFFGTRYLPPEIPVYYGKSVGQERLAAANMLAIPAFISLTITVFNFILAIIIKNQYFKKILAVTSLTISVFALTTTIKIFFLVGSF